MLAVLSFSEYLRELARQEDDFIVPAEEVAQLEARFGSRVHGIGQWNADGSIIMSRKRVSEALRDLGKQTLTEAAIALDARSTLANVLNEESPAAADIVIERLRKAKEQHLRSLIEEFQNTPKSDKNRYEELRRLIDRAVFPQ